jgi:methyltransferase (TIGR00027 family)
MCLARALELRRPVAERIVDDPWAPLFLGPLSRSALTLGRSWLGSNLFPATLVHYILVRQRFTDEHLCKAMDRGVSQLVVLGAGYDTRAWRYSERLDVAFEVDHPATSARKRSLVQGMALPPGDRRVIVADLATADLRAVLLDGGFDPSRPTFFAWEGVTMYLERDAILQTLRTLRSLMAPGSALSMDLWWDSDESGLSGALWRAAPGLLGMLGEPLVFRASPAQIPGLLAEAGLDVAELATSADLAERFVPDQRKVFENCCVVLAVPDATPGPD